MMHAKDFTRPPGKRFRLDEIDPGDTRRFKSKSDAGKPTADNLDRLRELHERLYADGSKGLLIILQAMDTAGKDGTITHVLGPLNPQGVTVTPFKVPTELELAHDFLWRVHAAAPARGSIAIFNRSHYEDVLVVRVKKLVPTKVWKGRYDLINSFERLLADSGITIVKLFLHISPEEQAERLRERQETREKQWKFVPGDLDDRKLWPKFMQAYEDALTRCNTSWAPWYVVPANRKWYRNLVVSQILVQTLEGMKFKYPKPIEDIDQYVIPEV
jgi:PPK2 family polyphosphate:nucleotide phosphotransferase